MVATRITVQDATRTVASITIVGTLDEVILAVTAHPAMATVARYAAGLAADAGARLTVLAAIDTETLSPRMAVPIGGMHYAARLARTQLMQARDCAADAARQAVTEAAAFDVRTAARYCEGKPDGALFACDHGRALVVMPAGGWFDHGIRLTQSQALAAQLALDATPLLLVREIPVASGRLALLHDGSADSEAAIRRFVEHPFVRDREVVLAGVAGCSEEAANAVATILSRQGIRLQLAGRFLGRQGAAGLASCLASCDVIAGNRALFSSSWMTPFGYGTWRIAQRTGRSILLI